MTTDISGEGTGGGERAGRGTNATSARKLAEALTSEQYTALELMTEGKPIRVAAEKAGVNRATVYRWIKGDPQFRAAYNAWQLEHRESCRLSLLKCADEAVAYIAERVHCDEKLAFAVAKELGLFKAPKNQATDPRQVRHEIVLDRWEEEAELDRRLIEQTSSKKNRRLLEVDLEEEIAHETSDEQQGGVA